MTLLEQPHSRESRAEYRGPRYPRPGSIQAAGWVTRLRHRRVTSRMILAWSAALVVLLFAEPVVVSFVAGAALVTLGVSIRIWTFGHLRKNQALVTTGPYAYTRNPAYVGSALIMSGLFLAAGNPFTLDGRIVWGIGLAGIAVFFVFYLPRKYAREYGKLKKIFPDEIQRHAAHVPDFFPRLTPWRSDDDRRFSWQCVKANHEWVWPLLSMGALIVIWLQ